jgi:hypothetical protein
MTHLQSENDLAHPAIVELLDNTAVPIISTLGSGSPAGNEPTAQ